MNDVAITLSKRFYGRDNLVDIMTHYHLKLEPLVMAFEGFHDLEDDDGDEDEEDYRLSWVQANSDDEIDEPDDVSGANAKQESNMVHTYSVKRAAQNTMRCE
jgi:hypothetical protein